jgi:hypothetical protein
VGTKTWTDNNNSEIIMEDPETAESVLLEIIVDVPMSVFVDPGTGAIEHAEIWVDRRTPEEFGKYTKFQEWDKIQEAYDYFKAHIEEPDREEP